MLRMTITILGSAWTVTKMLTRKDGGTNYLGYMTDFDYSGEARKLEMK